jgi:hypothetical protein
MVEYLAEREQAYRETVVYPAAARRAQWTRELRLLSPAGHGALALRILARLGVWRRPGGALASREVVAPAQPQVGGAHQLVGPIRLVRVVRRDP